MSDGEVFQSKFNPRPIERSILFVLVCFSRDIKMKFLTLVTSANTVRQGFVVKGSHLKSNAKSTVQLKWRLLITGLFQNCFSLIYGHDAVEYYRDMNSDDYIRHAQHDTRLIWPSQSFLE